MYSNYLLRRLGQCYIPSSNYNPVMYRTSINFILFYLPPCDLCQLMAFALIVGFLLICTHVHRASSADHLVVHRRNTEESDLDT